MVFKKRLTGEQRALAIFLRSERKYSYAEIGKKTKMSPSSVFRVVNGAKRNKATERKKLGRHEKLTVRDKRKLHRAIISLRELNPNFTVMEVVQRSGIDLNVAHYRTFLRQIRKFGYQFRQSRKKGLLSSHDLKERLIFAKKMVGRSVDYWTKDVAFYLDGVSFVFKGNPLSDAVKPKSRVWRKMSEGLLVTTKGSKDLAGGKRLHLIVAICYGKGVILAEPYEKMNAEFFAHFVRRHFPNLFDIAGIEGQPKIFLMDNDPSQTSARAKAAFAQLGYTMQKIPPRSPDLNPIENVFHLVRKNLEAQTRKNNITHQTWEQFKEAVRYSIWSTSKDIIDKTISSLPKRLQQIIATKGKRTKY